MKNFVVQNSFITFAALEPAKPLNDAQIGRSFYFTPLMKNHFTKPALSIEEQIQLLRQAPLDECQR